MLARLKLAMKPPSRSPRLPKAIEDALAETARHLAADSPKAPPKPQPEPARQPRPVKLGFGPKPRATPHGTSSPKPRPTKKPRRVAVGFGPLPKTNPDGSASATPRPRKKKRGNFLSTFLKIAVGAVALDMLTSSERSAKNDDESPLDGLRARLQANSQSPFRYHSPSNAFPSANPEAAFEVARLTGYEPEDDAEDDDRFNSEPEKDDDDYEPEDDDYNDAHASESVEPTVVIVEKQVPGPPGPRGEPGQDGRDGRDGLDGLDGRDGRDGLPGVPGRDGERGEAGRDGERGAPGRNGERGAPGQDGQAKNAVSKPVSRLSGDVDTALRARVGKAAKRAGMSYRAWVDLHGMTENPST